MAKSKQQKQQDVQLLVDNLKSAKSVVFANFQGLKVKESEELRKLCREQNVKYIASKKTILKLALKEIGLDINTKAFAGSPAVIFGIEDEVAPAQIIDKFAKNHEVVNIFGGILENNFIDTTKVNELAKLPTKPQLLGQLVGTINAPISGFVNVLAGNLRNLINVLNAIKEEKN